MDVVIAISVVAAALFLVELLLPTGGTLAILGAAGLIAAGVLALTDDSSDVADYVGPGLITLGVVSLITAVVIGRKVVDSQMTKPSADMVGTEGEVRSPLAPEGQIFIGGALWRARVAEGSGPAKVGDRVRVQEIEGLTLIVSPLNSETS